MSVEPFPLRRARVYVNRQSAGILTELKRNRQYQFVYNLEYHGSPISLSMPVCQKEYIYEGFPPFFDGLLPEGNQLEALLKQGKLDRNDYFGQLIAVGSDMVGAVSVEEIPWQDA